MLRGIEIALSIAITYALPRVCIYLLCLVHSLQIVVLGDVEVAVEAWHFLKHLFPLYDLRAIRRSHRDSSFEYIEP